MENKINFLRKYNKNIEIVNLEDINISSIPAYWCKIFRNTTTKDKIKFLLKIWSKYMGRELVNTINFLHEHLEKIELVKYNSKYAILYTIRGIDGELGYYLGGNPNDEINNLRLNKFWNHFPESIRRFYKNIHNGFFYYSSESMGLVPLESVTFFGDDEWGIIETLEEPIQINLSTTFGFFKSGSGGYVAIDYTNCKNGNATLWFSDSEPEYNINFWDAIDEWIVIGFE